MKYIKLYNEASQYKNTDFYFPHVSFQASVVESNTNKIRAAHDKHALHLFTEYYMIKCEYSPAETIKLFDTRVANNIMWYVYNDKKYSELYKEDANILTFDEVPNDTIIIYFLIKDNRHIPAHMFETCANLINVTFTEVVTKINDYAFYGCTGLKEITLPNNCIYVGKYAFANCTNCTKITFNNSLQYVKKLAFQMGTKQIPNVEFVNLTPFTHISNKHGILFKRMRGKDLYDRKSVRLATVFSPEFFKDKSRAEKIQWANLLCGELLANIFFYDDDVMLKPKYTNIKSPYAMIIPNGVLNVSSLYIPIHDNWIDENYQENYVKDKELLSKVLTYRETISTIFTMYKIHIPNSVGTISMGFFNIIRAWTYMLKFTPTATFSKHIQFYLDKTRNSSIGINATTLWNNSCNYINYVETKAATSYSLTQVLWSVIHVLKSTYYKHICTRYNRLLAAKYDGCRPLRRNRAQYLYPYKYTSGDDKRTNVKCISNNGFFFNANFIWRYYRNSLVTRLMWLPTVNKYEFINCTNINTNTGCSLDWYNRVKHRGFHYDDYYGIFTYNSTTNDYDLIDYVIISKNNLTSSTKYGWTSSGRFRNVLITEINKWELHINYFEIKHRRIPQLVNCCR